MGGSRASLFRCVVLCGLSLSLGWGVRGNFGHSHGAMIPGALAALAAILVSGREDWWRRAAFFAMFGALGWSFGGRMSYMQVIAYTHSGHGPSQLYGYACLCVIGFLWAALGGGWTALPACLDRERLTRLLPPTLTVLTAWFLKNLILTYVFPQPASSRRHESILYWHDTSWVDALVALGALVAYAAVRQRFCWGTRFLLHLAVGWWLAFLALVLLVDGLGINFRMTPPRGDDWAGTLGMTAGMFVFFLREGPVPAARAALVAGVFGGAAFAGATFLKLAEVEYVPRLLGHFFDGQLVAGRGASTAGVLANPAGQGPLFAASALIAAARGNPGWQTNWHSVLEQTYGFFNGIGIGVAMYSLAGRVPSLPEEARDRRWTEVVAVSFTLVLVTYVNLVTDVPNWVGQKAIPKDLYGVPSRVWFDAGYAVLGAAVIALLVRHVRSPVALVPASPLGKAQLLYVALLWWIVVGNLMHAIPPFHEQRLITEGVIHLIAVCCTALALVWPDRTSPPGPKIRPVSGRSLVPVAAAVLVALAVVTAGAYWGTRRIYGDRFAGQANRHVRFGTGALPPRPVKGQPHP